jgi:hypothetical protein
MRGNTMNGLLAQNLSPASLLFYMLVAGPTGGCFHYGARRLRRRIGRVIARLIVLALVIGAIAVIWKTGLLAGTPTADRAGVPIYQFSLGKQ